MVRMTSFQRLIGFASMSLISWEAGQLGFITGRNLKALKTIVMARRLGTDVKVRQQLFRSRHLTSLEAPYLLSKNLEVR